jgi:hypothetical protein
MVGPTASVLTPCVPGSGTSHRSSRSASRLLTIRRLLASLALMCTSTVFAQGPGGPIQQTGFGGHGGVINRHLHPYPMHHRDQFCPEVSYEYVPSEDPARHAHLAALGEGARSLWYRLEYLNWTIEAPGEYPLGARRLSGNEEGPFDAVDVIAEGFATQPDAREFDLNKNNGLRFTIGASTRIGDLEANVWVLDQADSDITIDPVRRFDLLGDPLDNTIPNFFAAVVLMSDGQLSDTTMLLFDQGYRATLKTDVFGTEANFIFQPLTPNQPLTIRPLAGFQFISYRENFRISGADERDAMDPADPTATVIFNRQIDAKAQNNTFAPQIGVRAEFNHEWFSLGVTPKFLLGFNRRTDQLQTMELLALGERTFQEEQATEVAPGFDLKVDARVHLNEHFSLFASYQLYVLSNISRPTTNINYDTVGGTQNNLNLHTLKQHQLWFGGVTVGGELRFH